MANAAKLLGWVDRFFAESARPGPALLGFGVMRGLAARMLADPVGVAQAAAADPWLGLFFALCQFPLFLSPFLLRPVYMRVTGWAARRETDRVSTP